MKYVNCLGEAAAARLDFLRAAARLSNPETGQRAGVHVNRMHCRPYHPHGARLVADGLMRLVREGRKTSRHSVLFITEAGLAELQRLERNLKKRQRKFGVEPDTCQPGLKAAVQKTPQQKARIAAALHRFRTEQEALLTPRKLRKRRRHAPA